ncbi:MAG: bacillithiol system redox-active protein YtxJ [Salinibacter sp.]
MPDPFHPLTSESAWNDARTASEDAPVLIFKHSNACPVSAQAQDEMTELSADTDLPVYRIVVQESRSVSDAIEADLDVRHETPQAILLRDRRPVFDASHFDVTADAIRDALSTSSASTE